MLPCALRVSAPPDPETPSKPDDSMRNESASLGAALVETEAGVGQLVASLRATLGGRPDAWVAFDTEADSFHHYFEKVCLLQLAVERERPGDEASGSVASDAVLVDPLAADVAPLLEELASRTLLMHGSDYDLRLLFKGHGFVARGVFDTMVAAQLLGEPELSLASLLAKRAGATLDKKHQRADWSARPLPAELVAYAAADVTHLFLLARSLRADLEAAGRLAWHEEECARLVTATQATKEKDEEAWRIKGTNALTDKERAYVRAFWEAREARARALDRPPFRVLTNEKLLQGARLAATGEGDLGKLLPQPRPLPPPFAAALRDALHATRALPATAWPAKRRGEVERPDPAVEREVLRLRERRDRAAAALKLDPSVLAPQKLLAGAARVSLARGGASAPGALDVEALVAEAGFSRWRAELLARTT